LRPLHLIFSLSPQKNAHTDNFAALSAMLAKREAPQPSLQVNDVMMPGNR
jgi:hypothetical protein